MLSSIMNYENRGHWGDSKYRGNCSGHVIKDLLQHFKPKNFVEVFAGSGTGYEVAKELGYTNSIHLDLNGKFGPVFNALTDEMPSGSDFVFSHPPYHNMIIYSGNQWGDPHPDDLSRCDSYEDFIKKLNIVNHKIYNSLVNGGRHAMLIGDMRKNGKYYSMIKDIAYFGELESHIIKTQHNTVSGRKSYSGNFIPIEHEHLIILKKMMLWQVPIVLTKSVFLDLKKSIQVTWRDLIQTALQELGGKAPLSKLYEVIETTEKAKQNQHWKAKVRQILQIHDNFAPIDKGIWKLAI